MSFSLSTSPAMFASRAVRALSSSSVPSWAQRATEPLVPSLDLAGVKKDVQRDLKEIKRASDDIGRLAKKRASKEAGPQLLSISERTRERARGTSRRLREALALATEGSADHAALTQLSVPCRGANTYVGRREVDLASRLLVADSTAAANVDELWRQPIEHGVETLEVLRARNRLGAHAAFEARPTTILTGSWEQGR